MVKSTQTLEHPSIGSPFRLVLVGMPPEAELAPTTPIAQITRAPVVEPTVDSLIVDWLTASYLAPGVKPRSYAVVVRVRSVAKPGPPLLVVTPSYPSATSARPTGLEMMRSEAHAVADAIIVARSSGLRLDSAALEYASLHRMAVNERIDVLEAGREFATVLFEDLRPVVGVG